MNMKTNYSVEDLFDFLNHASDRGLMPVPATQALAAACRAVFSILGEEERADVTAIDIDAVFKRFENKRAKEFNPSSLKEYRRRVARAVELFANWRSSPADFSVKTRTTHQRKPKHPISSTEADPMTPENFTAVTALTPQMAGTHQLSFPVRPGGVITLSNVPVDLSAAEAERLAQFVKLLVVE
jgi:hypothetical protein